MPDFGRKTAAEAIRESLPNHHDGKWGLAVYRCVYGNDEEWSRFMACLYAHAYARLEDDEHGSEIKDALVFDVREDETELSGATESDVRRRHLEWVQSIPSARDNITRYAHCIRADAGVVDSVLNGEAPGLNVDPTAFVHVVDLQYEDEREPLGPDDIADDEDRREHNAGNEGYPPVGEDGCRRFDVGWMKVSAASVAPTVYEGLMDNRWPSFYVRPPEILDY